MGVHYMSSKWPDVMFYGEGDVNDSVLLDKKPLYDSTRSRNTESIEISKDYPLQHLYTQRQEQYGSSVRYGAGRPSSRSGIGISKSYVSRWVYGTGSPYDTRWTWKPVVRRRAIGVRKPVPIVRIPAPYQRRHYPMPSGDPRIMPHPHHRSIRQRDLFLHMLANQLLSKDGADRFKDILYHFRMTQSLPKLCLQLKSVITSTEKMVLLVELGRRIPRSLRDDFNRLCSLHFERYYEVLYAVNPKNITREQSKVIAQDSAGSMRILAKGNQKSLVISPHADHSIFQTTASEFDTYGYDKVTNRPVIPIQAMPRHDMTDNAHGKIDKTLHPPSTPPLDVSSGGSSDLDYHLFNPSKSQPYNRNNTYPVMFRGRKITVPPSNAQPPPAHAKNEPKTGHTKDQSKTGRAKDQSKTGHTKDELKRGPTTSTVIHRDEVDYENLVYITLERRTKLSPLGVSIHGGKDQNRRIAISQVEPGSQAERKGLRAGDVILEVNGDDFRHIKHDEAVAILRAATKLRLGLQSRDTSANNNNSISKSAPVQSSRAALPIRKIIEKDVSVVADHAGGLGFGLAGGSDLRLAVTVSEVFEDSAAQTAGLRKGDEVLSILGANVRGLTHKQIIAIATSADVIKMRICRKTYGEDKPVQKVLSKDSTVRTFVKPSLQENGVDGPQLSSSPVFVRKSGHSGIITNDDFDDYDDVIVHKPISADNEKEVSTDLANGSEENNTAYVNTSDYTSHESSELEHAATKDEQVESGIVVVTVADDTVDSSTFSSSQQHQSSNTESMQKIEYKVPEVTDGNNTKRRYKKRQELEHSGHFGQADPSGNHLLAPAPVQVVHHGTSSNAIKKRTFHSATVNLSKSNNASITQRQVSNQSIVYVNGAPIKPSSDVQTAVQKGLEKKFHVIRKLSEHANGDTDDDDWQL